jgi:colanic acid/amylovoran biosynthesis glycosyltransferase
MIKKNVTYLFFFFLSWSIQAKPLKILMLTNKFPYAPRVYINNQIAGLIDAGNEVFILANKVGEGPTKQCPIFKKYNLKQRTFYNELPNNLRDFDIVYAQFGTSGLRGIKLLKKGYISGKLIVSFRGKDATYCLFHNPHLYDELFTFADLCLPVCLKFKDILIHYGCPQKKLKVLHSSINCDDFSYYLRKKEKNNQKINILTVARLEKTKGIDYAIQAISKLKKFYLNIVFTIIGDGPEYENLKNLIKKLNLEGSVVLAGYKKQEEIIRYLQESDIFIYTAVASQSTEQDGIANVLKEAMATGLAPIITNHGGNSEIIQDAETGFIVSERDTDALVEKIIYMIEHAKTRILMGKRAARFINNNFCMSKLNEKLTDIMRELLEHSKLFMGKS